MKIKHEVKWEALIILGIFVLALLPRIMDLNVFITPDEPKWTCRSINFRAGLTQGDFAQTYQTGHPGVITMWIGTLAMPPDPAGRWQAICQEKSITLIIRGISPQTLADITRYLYAARRGVAILTAASVVIIYLMVRRLLDRRTALIGALLIALDPFYLAHSRLLHLDAIATAFMTISLLSLLIYLTRQRPWPYLALSGAAAALAALNKTPALFLAPFAGLTLIVLGHRSGKSLSEIGQAFLLWALVAGLIGFAIWPALWVNPAGTIENILSTAFDYAANPHSNFNFFWGEIRPDPGPWFYPVAWAFRTTPLVMLGLMLSAPLLIKGRHSQRTVLAELLAYSLLFAGFMTVGAKKFDRYILPIFPALDIIAAFGIAESAGILGRRLMSNLKGWRLWNLDLGQLIVIAIVLAFSLQIALAYHPHYLPYYNPLVGGSRQAPHTLLVGWGEGLEEAANYLNQKEGADELRVALRYMADFAPLFVGRTIDTENYDPATTDYVVIYLNQVLRDLNPELIDRYYEGQEPEYTVNLQGIDYAWVYPNLNYRAPMEYIASHAEADGDVILVSTPSLFTKHYDGDLPLYIMDRSWGEAEIVAELSKLPPARRRIRYVRYLEENPNPTLELIDYQLAAHAFKLEERVFPDIKVSLYRLFGPASFRADAIQFPLNLNLSGELEWAGYGLAEDTLQWGRDLGLAIQWKAQGRINRDYTLFLHLEDQQGHRWGQGDKLISDSSLLPTSFWDPGETTMDRYRLALDPAIPPGEYLLKLGVYNLQTGERLQIINENGSSIGIEYIIKVKVVRSPLFPSLGDLQIPHIMIEEIDGLVKLLGYGLNKDEARFKERLTVSLFWEALAPIRDDLNVLIQLKDAAGGIWAEDRFPLANELYPTSQWEAGEVIRGQYDLTVDAKAPTGRGQLEINLVSPEGKPLLEDSLILTGLPIVGRERLFAVPSISHPMRFDLGRKVRLLGYDLSAEEVASGGSLRLTLYWQALESMKESYTVFLHLVDENDHIWAQRDSWPQGGSYPTVEWVEEEVVIDEREVAIGLGVPSGEYRLEVGMYDLETGERIPVFDEGGTRMPQGRILLRKVRVEK